MFDASIIFNEDLVPKKGTKIPFGIHTDCKLTSVDVTEDYVDLNFEDNEGRFNNKRLWAPNGKYPKELKLADGSKKLETAEEALLRDQRSKIGHVVNLLNIFEIDLKTIKGDYLPFMKAAAKVLNSKAATKTLNLKLIYDSEGKYAEFGGAFRPDYVEAKKDDGTITLEYTKWEKENRCTPAPGESNRTSSARGESTDSIDALLGI